MTDGPRFCLRKADWQVLNLLTAALMLAIPVNAREAALTITDVNVVDVIQGRIVPHMTVTIQGDTIANVRSGNSKRGNGVVVDGRGKFLIPGLCDMHAHIEMVGASWLQLYVPSGVTCIRDMGSNLDLIVGMRQATSSGRVLGPRIFAAGPILDNAPGDWPFRMRVKTASEGQAAVQLLRARGVDLIKVHDHTPREAYFAIAEEARRLSIRLAGHLPLGVSVEEAIDAGQDDIEHLSNLQLWDRCSGGDEYKPDACRPFFEMLAKRHIWQTPTLFFWSEVATIGTPQSRVSGDRMAYVSPALKKFWSGNQTLIAPEVAPKFRQAAIVGAIVTNDMAKAGVGILAGCDSMIADSCVHDELQLMVSGGMSPAAALQTATVNPARYFGLDGKAGSVAPGHWADLVLLDGDPLADIANLRQVRAVILRGQLLEKEDLDKLRTDVRVAAGQP